MVVTKKYIRFVFVLCICLGGIWFLTRSSSPTPDSLLRQQAMQSLAPGNRQGGDGVVVEEGVQIWRKTAVFPTTVNLADIPSRPSPVDKLQQQYLDGKVDLAEQERPVSESLFQTMVAVRKFEVFSELDLSPPLLLPFLNSTRVCRMYPVSTRGTGL